MDLSNLSEALENVNKRESYYAGNLKRNCKIKALSQHHFVIPDCDDIGNLKAAYVFVQYVGVKIDKEIDHLLICRNCNKEAGSLKNSALNPSLKLLLLLLSIICRKRI